MSLLSTSADEAYSTRRALILIFLVAGGITLWRWDHNEPVFHVVLALAALALGIGIWRYWRWARWIALGACFLAIVTAFATPMLLELVRPFDAFINETKMTELFTSIFAAAFGVIGFKGLSYLRSEDARRSFGATGEGSFHVLVSSLCVATLLAGLFAGREVELPQATVAAEPAVPLPDLVVKRLCMSGTIRVEAEVANQGAGSYAGEFDLGFNDLQYARYSEYTKGEVPAPGRSRYVSLSNAYNPTRREGYRLAVTTYLDSSALIRESNEDNNRAEFEVVFNAQQPVNLPACTDGGDVEPPAHAAATGSAALPDLVIDALCMSPSNLVKAEVRNQGKGSYSGTFTIAYDDLRNARQSEYSKGEVPGPGKTTYVELNTASNPTGRDGYQVIVRTFVDTTSQVRESNEDNNHGAFEIAFDARYPTNLPRCP